MRSPALPLLVALAAAPLLGCPNTDPAIFIAPTLSGPAATVTVQKIGSVVTGAVVSASKFELDLHLGARASGPSQVKLGEFSIVDASQTNTIVPVLSLTGDVTFPATVQPDSTLSAHFTFDTTTVPLPKEAATGLCDPAGVVISGAIDDSLTGRSDPVQSAVFHPTCQ